MRNLPFAKIKAPLDLVLPSANDASFDAPLQSSLAVRRSNGSGTPTYSRATVAYLQDLENLYKQVPSGCARFTGARFVQNMIRASENPQAGTWTTSTMTASTATISDPLGGVTAWTLTATNNAAAFYDNTPVVAGGTALVSWWIRRRTGTGTVSIINANGTDTAVTLTTSWQRFAGAVVANSASGYAGIRIATSGDAVDVWHPQIELVIGQSNQNPSEYVSVGVLSAPYHGAGVDGCKYFTTLNGNTVASNVVTEATGAAITSANSSTRTTDAYGPFGYLSEGAGTQILATADIRDMTTLNWTLGATMTRARTSVGADGAANSATRLTGGAVAATNIITTTIVAAASSRTYSASVKRVTGTGPVRISQDNFATATDISSQLASGSYVLVQLNQSQLNAVMGFKIDTNGDAIDVDFNQFEAGAFATSRMAATGAARNADVLSYPIAGNFGTTQGTVYAEISLSPSAIPIQLGVSGADVLLYLQAASAASYDGTTSITAAGAATYPAKCAVKFDSNGGTPYQAFSNGTAGTAAAFDGSINGGATFYIGISGREPYAPIRNVRSYMRPLTVARLQAMTT